MSIHQNIAREMGLPGPSVAAVAELLAGGATIPFIARYRKERTGSMDEVRIARIRDRIDSLTALAERKASIIRSLAERELLTAELKQKIESAATGTALEDLYEKYRPRKKTRAMTAMENGLDPLARFLLRSPALSPGPEAGKFICPQYPSVTDVLAGARDILAQMINDDEPVRQQIRHLFMNTAVISCSVKKEMAEKGQKFKDYFDWSEKAAKAPPHRLLAMLRGSNDGILKIRVLPDEDRAVALIERVFLSGRPGADGRSSEQIRMAVADAYKRLLSRSIEKETIASLKQSADEQSIRIFAQNLNKLLLQPPLGEKPVMAIDPGFRTGCKLVCLDSQGQLLHHGLFYLHGSESAAARTVILNGIKTYGIQAVAIGNGTGGRETEALIRAMDIPESIPVVLVNESGASVYSASETARRELGGVDITVRGAVSIGRRLMDPLAELVKIDPKSIGVGQYQHDVDQKRLNQALDDCVEFCVNRVGVEVNTASPELLSRVSGVNDTVAANIVEFRNSNGPFTSRSQLLNVPRLGPKAYEQAAGFLRIRNGTEPLDATGIHPESYPLVRRMAADTGIAVKDLIARPEQIRRISLARYVTDDAGMPTLTDIAAELANPGRDPRQTFTPFRFDESVRGITDLAPGMVLPGIVTNVNAFGAFVDIGVHQDGLVHISRMADHFVKDPADIVTVRQEVMVTVIAVDTARKRIALSLTKPVDDRP